MLTTRDIPLIYIVDDEESVRKGLSRLLRSMGMPCREFASGEQFLAELELGARFFLHKPGMTGPCSAIHWVLGDFYPKPTTDTE